MRPCSRLAAVAAAAALVLAAAPVPTSAAAGAQTTPLVVATFNINHDSPRADFEAGVRALTGEADVIGLQEMKADRKVFLENRIEGWSACTMREQQDAVIWSDQEWSMEDPDRDCLFPQIAEGRRVENKNGRGTIYMDGRRVSVARLYHEDTGRSISVVSVHVAGGGVNNGKKVKGRPLLYRWYTDQIAGLVRVVADERADGADDVFVMGDFNNNHAADEKWNRKKQANRELRTKAGLTSAWDVKRELKPGKGSGSRGGSYLDNIWFDQSASAITVARKPVYKISDHWPVIARYALAPLT